jgi:hypothetical protein
MHPLAYSTVRVVRVLRTLTRTEDGNSIALGDPKTKKSGRNVRLTPGIRDALKRHRTRQAEEKLKADSAYQDGVRISLSTNSKIGVSVPFMPPD